MRLGDVQETKNLPLIRRQAGAAPSHYLSSRFSVRTMACTRRFSARALIPLPSALGLFSPNASVEISAALIPVLWIRSSAIALAGFSESVRLYPLDERSPVCLPRPRPGCLNKRLENRSHHHYRNLQTRFGQPVEPPFCQTDSADLDSETA